MTTSLAATRIQESPLCMQTMANRGVVVLQLNLLEFLSVQALSYHAADNDDDESLLGCLIVYHAWCC